MMPLTKTSDTAVTVGMGDTNGGGDTAEAAAAVSPKNRGNIAVTVSDIRVFLMCPRRLYYMNSAAALRKRREMRAESGFSGAADVFDDALSSFWFFGDDPARKYETDILKETLAELPYRIAGAPFPDDAARARLISDVIGDICADLCFSEYPGPSSGNDEKYGNADRPAYVADRPAYAAAHFDKDTENRLNEAVFRISANLKKTRASLGDAIFASLASPARADALFVCGIRTGVSLSGVISKILSARINGVPCSVPYIIRVSSAPENGVWESDRICGAAYLMLLESRCADPASAAKSGDLPPERAGPLVLIDYSGEIRCTVVRPIDRKKMFRALRHIRRIKSGEMPEGRRGKACLSCAFSETCRPKEKTLLSLLENTLR